MLMADHHKSAEGEARLAAAVAQGETEARLTAAAAAAAATVATPSLADAHLLRVPRPLPSSRRLWPGSLGLN